MDWNILFLLNSILLGVGLAMDAFSLSIANGLNETKMKKNRMCLIAGVYGLFQFAMPMIGWFCVHTILEYFVMFSRFIPWIALILLSWIGGKMIIEAFKTPSSSDESQVEEILCNREKLTFSVLILQGIATSIDALSVGFTISDYDFLQALICSLIICTVTFAICIFGLILGKKIGDHIKSKASILGGLILIGIGIEIFAEAFV